jgi:hypothetical protein
VSRPPKRKSKAARDRNRRGPGGTSRSPSLTAIFEAALRTARGIHRSGDPLEVEVLASNLLGTFDRPLMDVKDSIEFLGQQLVTFLVAKRSPDALALLHGIAAVADEPLAASARAGIVRLRAAGTTDPAVAGRIGGHRFLGAWTSIDEYGDQEMVAVSFADPTDQAHTIAFMIDHNYDGLVREAMLGPDLETIRTTWSETSGMAIVDLDAQELADRLGQGLRMYRLFLDPPVSDDVRALAILMRARLRVLPPAREPEFREVSDKERVALATAFARSKETGRSDLITDLARYFIDYRFDYTDGDPLRWSPIAVELCLLDWFPRKVTLDDEELASVPDALRRFVRYAGRQKGLTAESIAETIKAVDQFEPQFLAAMRDSGQYGPAKSIADEMLRDGVDLTDPEAVADWIEAFNARPFKDRDAVFKSLEATAGDALQGDDADEMDDADETDGAEERYGTTDPETLARRRRTIPSMTGSVRGIDASLLDPGDPDERRMLIELEHPVLLAAIERRDEDVEVDGTRINPRLHIALHEIVANQLWDGDPPDTWEAAQRLREIGHERHEILHMLVGAVSGVVWTELQPDAPKDPNADLRTALRALPGGLSSKGRKRRPH